MICLFCEKDHADSYICEERCEARVSAMLAMPVSRTSRQLTLFECMSFKKKSDMAPLSKGKKRPTPVPLETSKFFE